MTALLRLSALVFPLMISAAAPVLAAGFYIQEQSVSGLGASFAGQAAMPRDASIIFFNPSGMTHLDKAQVNLGLQMIYPHVDLKDTGTTLAGFTLDQLGRENGDGGNPGSLSPVPNGYFATPLTDDKSLWIGIGISAPFGLGVQYDNDFFGRYLTTKVDLRTIDIQPAVAWQPTEWLSLGGSVVVEHARANFQQKLANEDMVRLQGDDLTAGYNLGVTITPLPGTRIGLAYRSEINHMAEGRQTTERGSLGLDGDARAKIKLPDIATLGIAQKLDDQWTLLGQVSRTGWDNFDKLQVIPKSALTVGPTLDFGYQTSWTYSAGLEYEANDTWTFRAGYQYDQTPTQLEYRSAFNPDGDRHWFSGGATYKWDEKLSFDVGGTYINVAEEPIDQTRAGGVHVKAQMEDAYVLIGAVGLNYKF